MHLSDNPVVISGEPAAPERARKRRDISSRPRGVFRLAETVPPTWHGDGEEGEVLKVGRTLEKRCAHP